LEIDHAQTTFCKVKFLRLPTTILQTTAQTASIVHLTPLPILLDFFLPTSGVPAMTHAGTQEASMPLLIVRTEAKQTCGTKGRRMMRTSPVAASFIIPINDLRQSTPTLHLQGRSRHPNLAQHQPGIKARTHSTG